MMMIRAALVGFAAVMLTTSAASAQGRAPQKAVAPDSVMKSMIVKNPKSKGSLSSRFGMVRRAATTPAKPLPPTSVREIKPAATK
jgi:hypothetical protein